MEKQRSVALHTLGCKLNFSETSTLSRRLEQEGFQKKSFDDIADVYVINTCSVTDNADKECRQIVRRIQRNAPDSFVVIIGCYAQLKPKEIADIPGVDLVLGAAEKFNIVQHIEQLTKNTGSATIYSCDIETVSGFNAAFSINDRTRTFLKVQDGCNYNCSFCTIPMARGISRSDTIASVIKNAEAIAASGIKEIVLTGVNLGDFGQGPDGKKKQENFFQLIQQLDHIEGIERFRISSIEPNLLSNEIIQFVAGSKKFMPHFHIPLQSGSDNILGLMRRRYKREVYREKVQQIKTLMPHCAIGVDVIVGFPGETNEAFHETHQFLHELDVSYLHVFTYSERPNTLAITMDGIVPIHIRNERNKILRNLSFKKLQYFIAQQSGAKRKVLFEDAEKNGMMEGYTDNYIRIQTPYRKEWANQIVDWEI
ncbi:MAG: tRNA (N(6)-L-threonylcarbamoyladenosine(37)-C(2))-methylthiotransferase MtaB [Sphingobacteriales bacterium]|uniref:tRNA (N(6)-L-threonylcarbamoyladenosine(37)-C(2))- methylthiotransferase MtaB n=1 Tax=Hydrotalea flava TaxID=714549 RepID=UPI0008368ABC|nr:tRNA (N(6)-L-threonylcarbamoyladenosine(37)-C(2))-methylthiotransferase MtaB [Hydrotalea flava]RTL56644.1 MAG: tRNA (N(6)-L-threonylcarbamoyladenosine(37)-C(2))-methylthiotransferase MtaB [Sphingobacteriales bacterium]